MNDFENWKTIQLGEEAYLCMDIEGFTDWLGELVPDGINFKDVKTGKLYQIAEIKND